MGCPGQAEPNPSCSVLAATNTAEQPCSPPSNISPQQGARWQQTPQAKAKRQASTLLTSSLSSHPDCLPCPCSSLLAKRRWKGWGKNKKNNKNTRWVHVGLPTHSEGQPVLPGVLPEDDGGDAGDAHGSRVPRGSCPPHGSRVSLGRERQLLNTSRGFNACHRLETGPGQARSTLTVSPMGKWGQRCQCEL